MQAQAQTQAASIGAPSWPRRLLRNLAVQDWAVVVYFCVLLCAVSVGKGPGWQGSLRTLSFDLAMFVVMLVLVRGAILAPESRLAGLCYRIGIFGPVFLSYFQLREVIPSVTQRALDAELYAFDLRLFHYEPSVAWDHFVTPSTVEWFAFFYGLYFLLVALHVLPWLMLGRDGALIRAFGIGILSVFLLGHIGYLIVPGYGPFQHLAFDHALTGGRFWKIVLDAVHDESAIKDIFPSLHTAVPSFLLFFSFVHRRRLPFRFTWPPLAFLVSQIVIATMFLRWHYLIDVIVGLALALAAVAVGARVGRWETPRRERLGLQSIFGVAPLRP